MFMGILLAVLWILSPPVLIILLAVRHSDAKKYKRMYEQLLAEKNNASEGFAAVHTPQESLPPDSSSASGNTSGNSAGAGTASAPAMPPAPEARKASAYPYNMPYMTPPVVSASKPASDVSDTSQSALKPAQSVSDTSQSAIKPAQSVSDTSQSAIKPAQSVPDTSQNALKPAQSVSDTSQSALKPAQSAPDASQSVLRPALPSPSSAGEKNGRVSSMNIMLILGALLIIISGLIFATTTWEFLSGGIRAVVILSFSVVFFAVSSLAERKLSLEKTGLLFYTLGSVFLPVTIIAAGYFEVFGEWFSLSGEGRPLLLAVTFAALSAVCVKGSVNYRLAAFSWSGLVSLSIAVCSLIFQFTDEAPYFALCASVYGLAVIFAGERLSAIKSEKFSPLLSQLNSFAAVNTIILSISSLVSAGMGGNGVVTLVSCVIFASGYLKSCFTEKNGFSGAVPFALFMTCGMFAAFSPDDFRGTANTLAAASAVPAVLSFMNIIPGKVRGALKYISGFFAAAALLICGIAAFTTDPSPVSLAAYAVLAAEILALGLIHRGERSGQLMLCIFPAACVIIAAMLSKLIFPAESELSLYAPMLWLAVIAAMQAAFIFAKKLNIRTTASDVIFALFGVIAEISFLLGFEYGGVFSDILYLLAFFLSAAAVAAPVIGTEKSGKKSFFAGAAMLWGGFGGFAIAKVMTDLHGGYGFSEDALFISSIITVAAVSAVSLLTTYKGMNRFLDTVLAVMARIVAGIYVIALFDGSPASVIIAMAAAFSVLRYAKLSLNSELTVSAVLLVLGFGVSFAERSWIAFAAYAVLSAEILAAGYILRGSKEGKMLNCLLPAGLVSTATIFSYLISDYTDGGSFACLVWLLLIALLQTVFVTARRLGLRTGFSDVIYGGFAAAAGIYALTLHSLYAAFLLPAFLLAAWTIALPAVFSDNDKKQLVFTAGAFLWGSLGAIPTERFIRSLSAVPADAETLLPENYGGAFAAAAIITCALLIAASLAVTFVSKKKSLDLTSSVCARIIAGVYIFILLVRGEISSPVFVMLTIMSAVRFRRKGSKPEFISALLLFTASAGAASADIFEAVHAEQSWLFMCGASALIYISALLAGKESELSRTAEIVSRYLLGTLTSGCLLFLAAASSESPVYIVMTALFFLMTVTAFYNARSTAFLFVPLTAVYFTVSNLLEEYLMSSVLDGTWKSYSFYTRDNDFYPVNLALLGLIAASMVMSFIFHRNALWEKDGKKYYIDQFAFTRFIGVILYYNASRGAWSEWCAVPLFGLCLLTMSRKSLSAEARRWIYTVSAAFPVIAWLSQPFFDIPEIILLEFRTAPFLLYCFGLKLLWKHRSELIDNITFAVYVISFVTLFFGALSSGEIADGLIIVISSLLMLIFSFMVKRRKWFILSVSVMVISTLFMSRSFWASLAWWVYLLAAGLILIAIGAANEMKKQAAKQNKTGLEEKITRFMSEWTW